MTKPLQDLLSKNSAWLWDEAQQEAFHVETDHKPLVSFMGSKNLNEMPPRIQRLRMRLLRF